MKIEFFAVDIVATFIYSLGLLLLLNILYSDRQTMKKLALFTSLFTLTNGLATYYVKTLSDNFKLPKTFLLFMISVLLIKFFLLKDYKRSFISFGIYTIILAISETLSFAVGTQLSSTQSGTFMLNASNDLKLYMIGNGLLCVFAFVLVMIVKGFKSYFKLPKNTKMIVTTVAFTMAILFVNMWFFLLNVDMKDSGPSIIVVISLIILYSTYILCNINVSNKLEAQKIDLEQQKFYNQSLDKTLDNLRRFKHGYNNNLNVLFALAKIGDHDRLLKYFNEVMEMNDRLSDTMLLNIKNAGLYGIVSSKIQYSEEKQVRFKITTDSEVQEIKNIRMSELCEIMGIFLDNAIEAAAESEEKITEIHIRENEECISLVVKNSFGKAPNIEKIYQKGYSSKGESRGMGLWIVKDVLKNNKYVLNNTFIENNMFHQELIIKKGA